MGSHAGDRNPADSYVYELIGTEAKLLFTHPGFEIANIASDFNGDIIYRGYEGIYENWAFEEFGYKYIQSTQQKEVYPLFNNDFFMHISEEFYFISPDEIVFKGYGKECIDQEKFSYAVYSYNIKNNKLKKLFDLLEEYNGYTNSIQLQKIK